MSTDARDSLSPPPPVREGQRLRSGRMRAFPITAGDQHRFSCTYVRDGPAGRGGHGFDRDKAGLGQRLILIVMDDVPLRGIGPSARISAIILLFQCAMRCM
jgi:hypothetical protein